MVTIYTTNSCPYCNAAKNLLRQKKIEFKEMDVSEDDDFDALVARTGWKTVPQIFNDDVLLGGYQELIELDKKGKLDQLIPKI